MKKPPDWPRDEAAGPGCPVPIGPHDHITMAHGGGGELMHRLIDRVFVRRLGERAVQADRDAAVIDCAGAHLAFTTDSYVVDPPFFPGGNIGTLAVNGTVNDLVVSGARPRFLSAGFIIEEGFAIADLERIVSAMRQAADDAGVAFVTGDTKVIEQHSGGKINTFINTSGIGIVDSDRRALGPEHVQPGDAVIVSGDVARHGMAVLSVREGLSFASSITSDCAPLVEPVMALFDAGVGVRCMRDATRGGLAAAIIELARAGQCEIALEESSVPVAGDVRAACELLGLDPLYVANEGRFVAFVAPGDAERALAALRDHALSRGACRIGTVTGSHPRGLVTVRTEIGARRILDLLSGEQLPRIC